MLTVKNFLVQLDKVKTWAEQHCDPEENVQVWLTDDAHQCPSTVGMLTKFYSEGAVNGRLLLDLSVDSSK